MSLQFPTDKDERQRFSQVNPGREGGGHPPNLGDPSVQIRDSALLRQQILGKKSGTPCLDQTLDPPVLFTSLNSREFDKDLLCS